MDKTTKTDKPKVKIIRADSPGWYGCIVCNGEVKVKPKK